MNHLDTRLALGLPLFTEGQSHSYHTTQQLCSQVPGQGTGDPTQTPTTRTQPPTPSGRLGSTVIVTTTIQNSPPPQRAPPALPPLTCFVTAAFLPGSSREVTARPSAGGLAAAPGFSRLGDIMARAARQHARATLCERVPFLAGEHPEVGLPAPSSRCLSSESLHVLARGLPAAPLTVSATRGGTSPVLLGATATAQRNPSPGPFARRRRPR